MSALSGLDDSGDTPPWDEKPSALTAGPRIVNWAYGRVVGLDVRVIAPQ